MSVLYFLRESLINLAVFVMRSDEFISFDELIASFNLCAAGCNSLSDIALPLFLNEVISAVNILRNLTDSILAKFRYVFIWLFSLRNSSGLFLLQYALLFLKPANFLLYSILLNGEVSNGISILARFGKQPVE